MDQKLSSHLTRYLSITVSCSRAGVLSLVRSSSPVPGAAPDLGGGGGGGGSAFLNRLLPGGDRGSLGVLSGVSPVSVTGLVTLLEPTLLSH